MVVRKGGPAILVGRGLPVDGVHSNGGIRPVHLFCNLRRYPYNLIIVLPPGPEVILAGIHVPVYVFCMNVIGGYIEIHVLGISTA